MILNGNARGGGADLARHLQKDENEHIEVHELRGFVSETLDGAFNEVYALSRGTKCRQYLYSLSLNPPETEEVETLDFLAAIERIEDKLGLSGQPRAIVFHEKEGRRHAHCVWSRINVAEMKAVQISFDRTKLKEVSRELFLEHGWIMPRGLAKESERDPRNYSLSEYQQAKRAGRSAREVKIAFQDAWAISDSKAAFVHALEERGFKLARGDRGRFVAVDAQGEVWSLRQQLNERVKVLRGRLGDEADFPSVNEVTVQFAEEMQTTLGRVKGELIEKKRIERAELVEDRQWIIEAQRDERSTFLQDLRERQRNEALLRQSRFRKGLGGIWDRLSGKHKRIQKDNEREAEEAAKRARAEHDALIFKQLNERREFKARVQLIRGRYASQARQIHTDQSRYENLKHEALQVMRDEVLKKAKPRRRIRRSRSRTTGPQPER